MSFNDRKDILVVDDDKAFLELLSGMLDGRYTVYRACSAIEALKVFENARLDAICTDYNLGTSKGTEIFEAVRSMSSNPKLILMSASESSDASFAANRFGAVLVPKTSVAFVERICSTIDS